MPGIAACEQDGEPRHKRQQAERDEQQVDDDELRDREEQCLKKMLDARQPRRVLDVEGDGCGARTAASLAIGGSCRYGSRLNGGYSSVMNNAYNCARIVQRWTPTMNLYMPSGYLPVNRTENPAMITTKNDTMPSTATIMKCGIARIHLYSGANRENSAG